MDRFRESVSDLARAGACSLGPRSKAPTPTGWPTERARHIASSALCRSWSASPPCSGQATTPAEMPIRRPPAALEVVELAQQPLRHLHAADGVLAGSEHAERVLLQAEGLVDEPDALAQRRADHGKSRLAPGAGVVVARPRPLDVEDDQGEGLLVAPVALEQLVEPAAHLAGAVQAWVLVLHDRGRPRRAPRACRPRSP